MRRRRKTRGKTSKSRNTRIRTCSPCRFSGAKSRRMRLYLSDQGRLVWREFVPGCVGTSMWSVLPISLVAGNFGFFSGAGRAPNRATSRKKRQILRFRRTGSRGAAGKSRSTCREFFQDSRERLAQRPRLEPVVRAMRRPPARKPFPKGSQAPDISPLSEVDRPSEARRTTQVGYKQPPVHSRWKPGQSGNPGGMRSRLILQEVLTSPFSVRIGRKTEMVPTLDAMLLHIRAKAMEGDQETIRCLPYSSPPAGSRLSAVH